MKKLFKAMAFIGAAVVIGTAGKMDYHTMGLVSDFPTYCYYMLYGGMSMMIPLFVYGIIDETKGGK